MGMEGEGIDTDDEKRQLTSTPPPLITSCATLQKLLRLSVPQFYLLFMCVCVLNTLHVEYVACVCSHGCVHTCKQVFCACMYMCLWRLMSSLVAL